MMKHLRNIIVALDFSPSSHNALKEAARIAAWDGADLTVLHVLDHGVIEEIREHVPELEGDLMVEAEGRLKAEILEVLGSGHPAKPHFVVENPTRAMFQLVKEQQADLIVMGASGRSVEDDHVGPLASRCVRKSSANVLLVRKQQVGPFRKVVACIDFSDNAARAAVQAIHLAQQDEAQLEFLHVHEPVGEAMSGVGYFTGLLPKLTEKRLETEERLKDHLQAFGSSLVSEHGNHPFESRVLTAANFRDGIVEALTQSGADLVVLGTRGKTSMRNLLLGSTAEKIIEHAPCSVLAIKPRGFSYDLH